MKKYLIHNVSILDGTENMSVLEGYDILVNNDRIEKIAKNVEFDGEVYDLSGKYVLPGLINMHIHLPGSGKVGGKKVADLKGLISFVKANSLTKQIGVAIEAKGAKMQLLSGVTTVRGVGGVGDCDTLLAKQVAKGKKIGPRILASNEAICTPGGHMEGTVSRAAATVEEAVRMVEEVAKSKADLIKLMITGGVLDCKVKGHPGDLKMSKEMVEACCKKAHELGLKVAAHVEGPEGFEIAAKYGVDTIEHGAPASDETLKCLKERNGALICTLSPAIPLALLSPEQTGYDEDCKYNSSVLLKGMIETVEKCLSMGIKVGLGTDTGCPYVTHYDMWRELVYYTKYIKGVDNRFALHSATEVNAEILGISDITGTVKEGKVADLMVVEKNPLEDLTALKEPSMVISQGRIYTEKNQKFANIEEVLDTLL